MFIKVIIMLMKSCIYFNLYKLYFLPDFTHNKMDGTSHPYFCEFDVSFLPFFYF